MKTLNKYSKIITQDETQPAAQAMLYAIGLTEEVSFQNLFFANPHQHICKTPTLNQPHILQKS